MRSEFERLVQIGMVSAVDEKNRKVRVKFKDTDLISDWLCVLKREPSVSLVDLPNKTGSGVVVIPWMPKVNDTVLVVYLPIFNSDGFVIGGI